MKRVYATVLLAVICLLFSAGPLWAAPSVDGFIEVPWGTSIDDVKTAMAKRGFTLQRQEAEHVEYIGTFANEPAQLKFSFKNNLFYSGEAELLNAKGKDQSIIKGYFEEFSKMVAAKYGSAEQGGSAGKYLVYANSWKNLPTAAQPPGKVEIVVVGIVDGQKPQDPNKPKNTFVIVYSIGLDWVRAQTVHKDI